jgi:site-specific recombinase XerD
MFIRRFRQTLSSDHTRRAYGKDLRLFESLTSSRLPEANRKSVRTFLAALHDRDEAVPTIRRRLSAVRSFYDWMQEQGHCDNNPARDVEVEGGSSNSADPSLDREDLQQLLSAIGQDTKRDARARGLILTTLYGALRRGPLARLNVEDVRPLGRQWVIDLASDHGRGGYVPIPSSAVQTIEKVKEQFSIDQGPLWRSLSNRNWGERLSPDALYKIVRRSGQKAGLEMTVTIDRLRTSGIHLALAAGAHPDDVRVHTRLQHSQSLATHLSQRSDAAGLRREVPALIEENLMDT